MKLFTKYMFGLCAIAAFATTIVSCSDENILSKAWESGESIQFSADISQKWDTPVEYGDGTTRSTENPNKDILPLKSDLQKELYLHPIVRNGINEKRVFTKSTRSADVISSVGDLSSFGVLAYAYNSTDQATTPNLLYNAKAIKSGNVYSIENDKYWPEIKQNVDYYAYHPYNNANLVLSSATTTGTPTISYVVPDNVSAQVDLMGASATKKNRSAGTQVSLSFSHVTTAIVFSIGQKVDLGNINSITLKNIYGQGVYTIGKGWTNLDNIKDFYCSNLNFQTDGTENVAITTVSGGKAFMMLPQTLPSNAQIEIVFVDAEGISHTLTANIGGQKWVAGTTVEYKISTSSIYWNYELTAAVDAVPYYGGSADFSIYSYRHTTSNSKSESIPWEIVGYSTDDGKTWTNSFPSWISRVSINSGTGGQEGNAGTWAAAAQTSTTSVKTAANINSVLKSAGTKGTSANRYDLSLHDTYGTVIPQSTANCYVITSPGYYKFPLVYGNAIKNGKTNSIAYTGTPALDYLDHKITNPYIKKSGTPKDAILLWQDAKNLISDVSLDNGGNGYIRFSVTSANIVQGNAVIALRDVNNKIMWSWHIWVADPDATGVVPLTSQAQHIQYYMMSVNLGYCITTLNILNYNKRDILVKVRQTGDGNAVSTFRLYQNSISSTADGLGSNVFYQFGRKDPFLRGRDNLNVDTTYYTPSGYNFDKIQGPVSYGTSIQHPNVFYWKPSIDDSDWCSTTYHKLWEAVEDPTNLSIVKTTKTIYDPCPVGFEIPPTEVFTAFGNLTGEWGASNIRRKGDFNHGYNYYVDEREIVTIFLPALGWRMSNNGNLSAIDSANDYWTTNTTLDDLSRAYRVFQASGGSYSVGTTELRSYGFNIRPIRDQ